MPIITPNGLKTEEVSNIIILANTDNADEVCALYHNAQVLGIEFPNYADGRGFTLAKRLRLLGFKGDLRAVGPLIPDQFQEAIDTGFDEVEISQEQLERQPIEQWLNALITYSSTYQQIGKKTSIIAKRWAKGDKNA